MLHHCVVQVPELKVMTAKFRAMVGHFKHSYLAREALADWQRREKGIKEQLSVIQDVPTR